MRHMILSRYLLSSVLCMAAGAATAAAPTEPKRLSAPAKELLLKIAGADATTGVVIDDSTAEAKTLAKAGWLLTNETTRNGSNIAVVLSPTGKAKADSYAPKPGTGSRGPQLKPEDFEVETGLTMPDFSASRRASRTVYPFEKLNVGDSFFIPAPADFEGDDFASNRQGTVSAQNRKAKEAWTAIPDGSEGKPEKPVSFKIVNDKKGETVGARVWRIS